MGWELCTHFSLSTSLALFKRKTSSVMDGLQKRLESLKNFSHFSLTYLSMITLSCFILTFLAKPVNIGYVAKIIKSLVILR